MPLDFGNFARTSQRPREAEKAFAVLVPPAYHLPSLYSVRTISSPLRTNVLLSDITPMAPCPTSGSPQP